MRPMRTLVLGCFVALAGCVPPPAPSAGTGPVLSVRRVDPQDAADRAAVGSVLGAALGTGLGATSAIGAGVGSIIGVESGAVIGAAIGAATAQPIPEYKPIPVPAAAVIPQFYDTWAPGYQMPAVASQAPPPPG